MFELCRVTTADGLELAGSWQTPDAEAQRHDTALLLIHGTGGNFYGTGILAHIAYEAVSHGYPVLRINTRGHDLVATIGGPRGPVQGGAAYEQVLECPSDLTAWCDWLQDIGSPRIILVGHSLGGVKAFWSQHLAAHPGVAGIVGVSPPRFSHARFQADPRSGPFRADFETALRLKSEGRGDTLINVTQPLPLVITAAGYLEKYGPNDPLDYVPILSQIAVPKLILVGSQSVEANPAFAELPTALESVAANHSQLTVQLVPGADINYRNNPAEPWKLIQAWMTAAKRERVLER